MEWFIPFFLFPTFDFHDCYGFLTLFAFHDDAHSFQDYFRFYVFNIKWHSPQQIASQCVFHTRHFCHHMRVLWVISRHCQIRWWTKGGKCLFLDFLIRRICHCKIGTESWSDDAASCWENGRWVLMADRWVSACDSTNDNTSGFWFLLPCWAFPKDSESFIKINRQPFDHRGGRQRRSFLAFSLSRHQNRF